MTTGPTQFWTWSNGAKRSGVGGRNARRVEAAQRTRGPKAECAGGAEAAAPHPGHQGGLLLLAGLVFAGRHQQADVGVQLDQ